MLSKANSKLPESGLHSRGLTIAILATCVYANFVTGMVRAAPNDPWEGGQWGPTISWPHIPVSAANLPDGRLITWSGSERLTWPSTEQTYSATWDPQTQTFEEIFHPTHNMFCSHLAMLKDGRVFVNGGRNQQNSPWTSIFDYRNDSWTQIEDMASGGRWYPTTVALPDGKVFTAIGSATLQRYPDIWDPAGGWSIKNGVDFNAMVLNEYGSTHGESNWWPLLHVAPNGQIFHSGPTPKMHYIDPEGGTGNNGTFQQVGSPFTTWYLKHGTTIMYNEGKLLTAGGWVGGNNTSSTNRALTIDLNGPSPVVQLTNSMSFARKFHNGVMLPTGEVLVIGGNTSGTKFSDSGSILATEMWRPSTGQWRTGASMTIPRNYHSVALLLTDGRVISAGGGYCSGNPTCSGASHPDAQIYSPYYLFNTNGTLATRPVLTSAPDKISSGALFSVQGTPNLAKFSLIKMSATTHGVNTDVRYIDVPFVESPAGSGAYELTANPNPNVLTAGYWMLFGLNQNGVPSVSAVLQANAGGLPSINSIPDQTTAVGESVSLQVVAMDPEEQPLIYSASGLPTGLTIGPASGLISGIPTTAGTSLVTVTVDDGNDGTVQRSFTWTVYGGGDGFVEREWWNGITGATVADLTSNANFPDNPSGVDVLDTFEAPTDWADNYGTRMFGYILPDASGDYVFWIASDDNSELWLSTDNDPANKVLIATVPGWSASREWNKFPEQQSAAIPLVAGERYYIEALQKEGTGGDNLAVAWQRPGTTGPLVIAGNYLSTEPVAPAATLADTFISGLLNDVGTDWITVTLARNYTNMVVVATAQYDETKPPAVTRVRNAVGNSFEVRVQNPSNQPLTGYSVQYVVVEAGVHNEGGVAFEAAKLLSTVTDNTNSWVGQVVTYQQNYTNPVVVGQVMTENDPRWSEFWAAEAGRKARPPTATAIAVGKHVGEDPDSARANETLGYIVFEAGSGALGSSLAYEAAVGPATVAGLVQTGSPYSYALTDHYDAMVLSSAGMKNSNGGWPLLYGSDPLAGNAVSLSYDEDQTKDNERTHGQENVAYLALSGDVAVQVQVDPVIPAPQVAGGTIDFEVTSNSTSLQYSYSFGDGTTTPFSSDPTAQHTYAEPGRYVVTITIIDPATGLDYTQTFVQLIHAPLTPNKPTASSTIAVNEYSNQVWVVNPDNDSVAVIDAATNSRIAEIVVGDQPVSLAVASDSRVWVTNKTSATLSIIDAATFTVVSTITMPHGSRPHGIAMNPIDSTAYVALEGIGELASFDTSTQQPAASVYVGPDIRHVSVSSDGGKVLVSRFITPPLPNESTATPVVEAGGIYYGGDVIVLNASPLSVASSVALRHSNRLASEHTGPGVPNYLGPAVISPDGLSAWVPSKQDNILAGGLRGGDGMTFDQTVRAVSSKIEMPAFAENFPARIDHDNASVATFAIFDNYGAYLFTSLEGNRQVAVSDSYTSVELIRFDVGRAPHGMALSADGRKLYVHNFMDRTVGVHDVSDITLLNGTAVTTVATVATVASESLPPQVLVGKQIFYDARDERVALQSYMSCASCHNDGEQDGRVWDFSDFGEGLRNTVDLNGRAGMGHGALHWSANFDEVQDFEGQIRIFAGGTGLMSDADYFAGTRSQPLGDSKTGLSADLDALAAYVTSLTSFPDSPHRNADGTLTPDGELGLLVFERENCAQCHTPLKFTDSLDDTTLHDVGTMSAVSGNRLGGPLTGIDAPTLIGVWQSQPYLHDGSAYDVSEAVTAHQGLGINLTTEELTQLASYLEQLDGLTRGISNTAPVSPLLFGSVTVDQLGANVWHAVTFAQSFAAVPIVVMGPPSFGDPDPATVRVRNVSASGFEFQIDEWTYQDGVHGPETIAWLAVERGQHDLGGITVDAGSYDQLFNKWRTISFGASFTAPPVVLNQIVTTNEATAVTVRMRNLGSGSFQAKVAEEEAQDGIHAQEIMHYVAFSIGTGTVNGAQFAVGNSGNTIDSDWSTMSFGGNYLSPLLLGNIQTFNGGDPVVVRYQNLLPGQVQAIVEEETSSNSETGHTFEAIGWLVISNP